MKLLFWTSVIFVLFTVINLSSQEIGQVVTTGQDEPKTNAAKTKVIVAIKTSLDSYGLDWNTYGIKPNESIDIKFAKSMLDWLTVSKLTTVEDLFIFNAESENRDFTHVIQWNLS